MTAIWSLRAQRGACETVNLAQDVLTHVGAPLRDVEYGIRNALVDASPETQRLTRHLTDSGGKRVRPVLTLLSARLFSDDVTAAIPVGIASEMIHMATLVHDDVIDKATTRRGHKTVNQVWGNHVSVLAGDALLAKALVILVDSGNLAIVRVMSDMIYRMCEGEVAQHATLRDVRQSEEQYYSRIEKKTALFFAACCKAGAMAVGASEESASAMWDYGRNLGMAFQVIDDLLDVSATEQVVGKPVGHDVRSGVLTLPVLYLLRDQRYEQETASMISKGDAISAADIDRLLSWVRENGALDYTRRKAESFADEAKKALECVPDSAAKDLLYQMVEAVLTRNF